MPSGDHEYPNPAPGSEVISRISPEATSMTYRPSYRGPDAARRVPSGDHDGFMYPPSAKDVGSPTTRTCAEALATKASNIRAAAVVQNAAPNTEPCRVAAKDRFNLSMTVCLLERIRAGSEGESIDASVRASFCPRGCVRKSRCDRSRYPKAGGPHQIR